MLNSSHLASPFSALVSLHVAFILQNTSDEVLQLCVANTVGGIFLLHILINNFENTVDSLYLELARDQKICSRYREFDIERAK